jgi:hypothetical protein
MVDLPANNPNDMPANYRATSISSPPTIPITGTVIWHKQVKKGILHKHLLSDDIITNTSVILINTMIKEK